MSLLYVVRKNTEESRINQYNERERKAIKYQRKLDRQWNIIGSKIIRKIDKAILKASKKGKASIQVDSFKLLDMLKDIIQILVLISSMIVMLQFRQKYATL